MSAAPFVLGDDARFVDAQNAADTHREVGEAFPVLAIAFGCLRRAHERFRRAGDVVETIRCHAADQRVDIVRALGAMDYIAALAREKEEATKAAQDSGLSARAFGVYWSLKEDEALAKAGISAVQLAKDAETVLARFPNAQVNEDERRRLRAALYRPLLGVEKADRGRVVEAILAILLNGGSDANA